jgi:hypothetical protein
MTQYKIIEKIKSGKYIVQKKPDYWFFWSNAFWQEFERLEDAQELLSIFKNDRLSEKSDTKKLTRLKISTAISRLINEREFLNHRSFCASEKASTFRLLQVEQKLDRLFKILSKL